MVKYLTVYQMSTVQFCYESPICPYSEMANTCDFLSQGQGSSPCTDTIYPIGVMVSIGVLGTSGGSSILLSDTKYSRMV